MFARNLLQRSRLVARKVTRGGHERTTDSAPIGSVSKNKNKKTKQNLKKIRILK